MKGELYNFKARRTPSISAPRNYVYKHVYIYFLAARQARAVGSLESGNLVVYGPLLKVVLGSGELWEEVRVETSRNQPPAGLSKFLTLMRSYDPELRWNSCGKVPKMVSRLLPSSFPKFRSFLVL